MRSGAAGHRPVRRPAVVMLTALVALVGALPLALADATGPAPALGPNDFPDPYVLAADGQYFAFSTNHAGNVPLLRSADLAHWQVLGDALPQLGRWALPGNTWAPAVLYRWPLFVLFYTARDARTGKQCIGRAIAKVPQGPYADPFDAPLLCQGWRGGSIDASPFVDANLKPYLYWKSEGTGRREPARLWGQQLTDDGLNMAGRGVELARADLRWEAGVVEAPSMARDGNHYWLFYSGNHWNTPDYAIGWAACAGPLGPCRKAGAPIIRSGPAGSGPGGAEAFRDLGDGLRLVYHAWSGAVGYPRGGRTLRVQRLIDRGGVPVASMP